MRTGPTRESTRELIVDLEKKGKKVQKAVWKKLSQKLARPTRQRAEINVYRLSEIALKNAGRVLVVPGKILSKGDVAGKIEVACFSCSKKAKEKIGKAGGKVMSLKELIESKTEPSKMVIVQ